MKKICMLMPGNPAVESYYQSWIEEIEERNPEVSVTYATSYVFFDKKLNYIEYDHALREHYEKILLALATYQKVTIIAHSVGSYFALRLLEKHPEKIEKIIMLFPYIGPSTIRSLSFVSIPYLIDRFFPLVEIVSKCKNMFSIWDKDVRNISSKQLNACLRFGVRQCEYFNKYTLDLRYMLANKEKIDFLYRDNDPWCPRETIESLKPLSNHKKTELPHDFITRKEHRIKMIKEIKL